ncbi:MAG: helicase C-terminal domain-containing protein [Anaerolineae bacterium]
MPRTYVAVDLETTGLDPDRDAIIEIGALRFDEERALERFSSFVNPGRSIPPFVTELTGITNEHVAGAPGAAEATRELEAFVGQDLVVGHSVRFDLAFLRRHGVLQRNPAIDTFEMAGIVVPHASRYSLANLVRELGLDLSEQTHRALDDAVMTRALFDALMARAMQLAPETLREIVRLGRQVHWPGARFFGDALYRRQRGGFQGGIGAQLADRRGIAAVGPLFFEDDVIPPPLSPRDEPKPVDLVALTALFEPDGPIAEIYSEYEYRDQQVEMMQAVGEAFNEGTHLLVEAGTGTGKSLAYLVPAIEWAVMNERRVVISTNTINLQEQLAHSDVPKLTEALYEFRAQVLKGRSHYLCRQQFEMLRRRGPTSHDEMRVLAKVLLWLPNTLEGDGDALFLPTAAERQIWHTISAATEACDPERCPFFQNGTCFFYRARAKAEAAHLIIVNHALLLADVITQNRVLPEYELLIVDEAHHLERATTESMRYSVSWQDLDRAFASLLRPSRHYPGLLEEIASAVGALPRSAAMRARDTLVRLQDEAECVQRYLERLFTDLEMLLTDRVGRSGSYGARLSVTMALRQDPAWDGLVVRWSQASPHLGALVDGLGSVAEGLEAAIDVELPELVTARTRLLAIHRLLETAQSQLELFIVRPTENSICWMEARNRGPFTLNVVPLHVGPLVHEHLLEKKRAVVMTSATLRIEGSFDYVRDRLGVGPDAEALALSSPFDYPSVALVAVVSDIPEPRTPGYQRTVEETLIDLFTATEGRALALFTSYSQLQSTTESISGPLARQGITVLAQGSGTSRAQLLESFRDGDRVALLGTRSFWEGVDVPGEALSCLVIVKLPFDVPDDPIVAARSQAYDDPFNDYMVPEAVLRFLQGFGRLIRTAADQGIAVVLDQRLLTKSYGRRFIDSLPEPRVQQVRRADLPLVAQRWLSGKPLPATTSTFTDDEPWLRSESQSPTDEDEEPSWFWGA